MRLGERMKKYEYVTRGYLTPRTPVIIRVDGKAFHTLTKNFDRPFDYEFIFSMVMAAEELFREMQGCKMAYIQSDEASFVLTDYDQLDTQGWFGYNQQKIVSVSASTMTESFNYHMAEKGRPVRAKFDSRAFNIPEAEVANYFLWRAQDWHRNSVSMYAQASFTHKELHRKNITAIHEMLYKNGMNWSTDLPPIVKNGIFLFLDCEGRLRSDLDVPPKYADISILWEESCSRINQ